MCYAHPSASVATPLHSTPKPSHSLSLSLSLSLFLSLCIAMEFKFRAKDGQASTTHVPPSSTIGYFTQQALRAGYSFPDFGHSSDFIRNPSNVREAIQRELEKERIREEIIATEIVRKRMLEAELRREMALAREMALRRGEGFSTFSAQSAMRFEPRLSLLHQSEGRFLEERLALSLEERLGYQAHHSVGGFEMMRFTRNAEPKISEIMPPSEVLPQIGLGIRVLQRENAEVSESRVNRAL
ncbi:unnamed protein product [Camellia sinensis]